MYSVPFFFGSSMAINMKHQIHYYYYYELLIHSTEIIEKNSINICCLYARMLQILIHVDILFLA